MKFDIYTNLSETTKTDDNTTSEKSTRKSYRNLTLEEAKTKVDEFFKSIPENATNVYFEMHKSYDEQMDAALQSI
jgi:hypothetical protein